MKVLFIMNYNVDEEWQRWQNSQALEIPAQSLWGLTHLSNHDIEVHLLPYLKYPPLKKIGAKLKLGDLDQQIRAVFSQNDYDLIYSSGPNDTVLLSIFRSLGILRKPLVVKLERPFRDSRLNRLLARVLAHGHDRLLCLSERLYFQLEKDFRLPPEKLGVLTWGAHLKSYSQPAQITESAPSNSFFMSAGGESRDYNTLVKAFKSIDFPLRVYCTGKSAPESSNIPAHVKVQYSDPIEKKTLPFSEILAQYNQSYAIAIPLNIPPHRANFSNSYGLTSLLDAMAVGKAVLMTRNKQIDIDIEKEKIGFWIDYQDIEGWRQAISYLLEHPEEAAEMGKRGHHLVMHNYNLENYASKLAGYLKNAIPSPKQLKF
jgi:glycosyltransferase involved in cell wall biosynthesis